jgi:hypothetical protein
MTTYVWKNGKMVEKRAQKTAPALQIIPDIQPYKSMIDGSMVTSRSRHRTMLRDNNCIEVGNEKMETTYAPPDREGRRKVLREQLADMSDRQANQILSELKRRN